MLIRIKRLRKIDTAWDRRSKEVIPWPMGSGRGIRKVNPVYNQIEQPLLFGGCIHAATGSGSARSINNLPSYFSESVGSAR
jgi:hypothetical protein